MNKHRQGTLFVISGASGTGKGTVIKELLSNHKNDMFLSVSATTRLPRTGEANGVHYFFKTEDEFKELIENDGLLEWACFCGNYYGTPRKTVEGMLSRGIDVILEIEIQGAMKIKDKDIGAKFIFILPPSFDELRRRLTERGTETGDVIEKRLETARDELKFATEYDYIVVNDKVDDAVAQIENIINAEKCRVHKNLNLISEVQKS